MVEAVIAGARAARTDDPSVMVDFLFDAIAGARPVSSVVRRQCSPSLQGEYNGISRFLAELVLPQALHRAYPIVWIWLCTDRF